MRTKKIGTNLCQTTGGGKFVPIPGFPGERIDRRLLPDIKYLVRKYKIFITDGYSSDPVHAANGEHPLGLALDIVPDKANGGSWKKISRLAERAEPEQDAAGQPVALGRLQRRRRPRPRQPPSPLLEPLRRPRRSVRRRPSTRWLPGLHP